MFASYVALFRGVVGERVRAWGESYEITMAGLAATRLLGRRGRRDRAHLLGPAQARMSRKETAARMVAFLVLLYAVYLLTLVINGILLRAGVLSGPAPAGLTIVPAAIGGGVIVVFLLIAGPGRPRAPLLARLAGEVLGPDGEAPGHRPVDRRGRHPRGARLRPRARAGGLAILGADRVLGGRSASSGPRFTPSTPRCPWRSSSRGSSSACSRNPLPGGVGGVDAGMIGAFALFDLGLGSATLFAAVLTYRLIAFWLPLVPGIIAFFQLRTTVRRWERERRGPVSAPRSPNRCRALPLQKVKCDRFGLGKEPPDG